MENFNIITRRSRSNKIPPIQIMDKVIVVGMDVVALYPSISKDMASKSIQKVVKETDIKWENIDTKYFSRYLTILTIIAFSYVLK